MIERKDAKFVSDTKMGQKGSLLTIQSTMRWLNELVKYWQMEHNERK